MDFYHIDRYGELKAGDIIRLNTDLPKTPYFLQFPDGLSSHGLLYSSDFMHHLEFDDLSTFNLEFVYELIRSKNFPDKLSRFQSLFAFESLDAIPNWLFLVSQNEMGTAQIVKLSVDHENYLKLDANLLGAGIALHPMDNDIPEESYGKIFLHSASRYYDSAFKYWSGMCTANPRYEILIKPPISVAEIVVQKLF